MSPERYPLVIFGGSELGAGGQGDAKHGVGGKRRHTALDPPQSRGEDADDDDVDACLLNPYDVHCLTGVRPLDESDGIEGRMRRLLDGPKTVSSSSMPAGQQPVVVEVGKKQHPPWAENASGLPTIEDGQRAPRVPHGASRWWPWVVGSVGGPESGAGVGVGVVGGMWDGVLVGLLVGLVSVWLVWVKGWVGRKKKSSAEVGSKEREPAVLQANGDTPETNAEVDNDTSSPILVNGNGQPHIIKQLSINLPPSTPTPNTTKPLPEIPPPLTAALDADEGDDSDAEGENGAPTTPGKRRARRGKRGKKKKTGSGGVVAAQPSGEDKEVENEVAGEKLSSSLVLTTSSPKLPVVAQPSLIVSDTILGAI